MLRKALVLAITLAMPAGLFAASTDYYRAKSLYETSVVPDSQYDVKAESVWLGRCLYDGKIDKSTAQLFFHVEPDEVLGNRFYIVPRFETPEAPYYGKAVEKGLKAIADGSILTEVSSPVTARAWHVQYRCVNDRHCDLYLRKNKTLSGKVAFVAKLVEGQTNHYCYYWQPLLEDGDSSEELVPAPPLGAPIP